MRKLRKLALILVALSVALLNAEAGKGGEMNKSKSAPKQTVQNKPIQTVSARQQDGKTGKHKKAKIRKHRQKQQEDKLGGLQQGPSFSTFPFGLTSLAQPNNGSMDLSTLPCEEGLRIDNDDLQYARLLNVYENQEAERQQRLQDFCDSQSLQNVQQLSVNDFARLQGTPQRAPQTDVFSFHLQQNLQYNFMYQSDSLAQQQLDNFFLDFSNPNSSGLMDGNNQFSVIPPNPFQLTPEGTPEIDVFSLQLQQNSQHHFMPQPDFLNDQQQPQDAGDQNFRRDDTWLSHENNPYILDNVIAALQEEKNGEQSTVLLQETQEDSLKAKFKSLGLNDSL